MKRYKVSYPLFISLSYNIVYLLIGYSFHSNHIDVMDQLELEHQTQARENLHCWQSTGRKQRLGPAALKHGKEAVYHKRGKTIECEARKTFNRVNESR